MAEEMYAPQAGSPVTHLAENITNSQTTIPLDDASILLDAPNTITIIEKDDFETIKYTGKNVNDLTGCTRGFEGSAKAWDSGTPVARIFTSQDLEVVQDNLTALDGHNNTLHSEDYIPDSEKGANNGVATLDSGGDVPASQLGNVDGMEVHNNTYHSPNYATESNLNNHIGDTGAAHGAVTTSVNGFMSSGDKSKLNGIQSNANDYSLEAHDNDHHTENYITEAEGAKTAKGTYTGNGNTSQTISLAFAPKQVTITADGDSQIYAAAIEGVNVGIHVASDGILEPLRTSKNYVPHLTASGFEVGASAANSEYINHDGTVFHYVAIG